MSQSFEFYQERAKAAAKEASEATLANVRDRALRSEAAWREMADRARETDRERKIADKARAERREAEAIAAEQRATAASIAMAEPAE